MGGMSRYTLGPEVLSSNASLEDVPRVRLHLAKHPFLMRVISAGAVLNCCGAVGEDVPLPPPPQTLLSPFLSLLVTKRGGVGRGWQIKGSEHLLEAIVATVQP